MTSYFLPPPVWFKTAIDIVSWAKLEKKIDDFILDCRMRPQVIGQSYSYRIDVMQELVRTEIVLIEDDKLTLSATLDVEWLTLALKSGNELAWELADAIGNERAIAKQFNGEELKRIGDAGENFVVDLLRKFHVEELHSQIKHISLWDDTSGFDIEGLSVTDAERTVLLEVKTTVRMLNGRFEFYLSRNELEVGKKNRNWAIVAVAFINGKPAIIGHLYSYQFESRIPRDYDEYVTCQTYKLSIECSLFRPGLP
jgi:hypothetical protein